MKIARVYDAEYRDWSVKAGINEKFGNEEQAQLCRSLSFRYQDRAAAIREAIREALNVEYDLGEPKFKAGDVVTMIDDPAWIGEIYFVDPKTHHAWVKWNRHSMAVSGIPSYKLRRYEAG